MKLSLIKRYELTNASDGWPYKVLRIDREHNGSTVRTWVVDGGGELAPTADGHSLVLPGTNNLFVLPSGEE